MKKNIFITALFILTAFHTVKAQHVDISSKIAYVGNTRCYEHVVQPGQSIYDLALAYRVNIDEIIKTNPDVQKKFAAGLTVYIPVVKTDEVQSISHSVAKGETLYRIASNYHTHIDSLKAYNTNLTDNIKPGQIILIPLPSLETHVVIPNRFSLHIVQAEETLYGIAKKYGCTIDEIKKANPGLGDVIQPGQQLKIPLKPNVQAELPPKDSLAEKFECGKSGIKKSYNVALLIPFYLENSYDIDTSVANSSGYKSLTFIEFYEGALMALDSLKQGNTEFKVHIYDVNENTNESDFLKQKSELEKSDLIIGPFFGSNFIKIADWAKEKKINIVNPFSSRDQITENNPFIIKLVASDMAQAEGVIGFIDNTYPNANLLIVHRESDTGLIKAFSMSSKTMSDSNQHFSYSIINYGKEGYSGLSSKLSQEKVNIIITLTDGEAFVSSYIRSLNALAYNYKIVLFGMPSWEQYSSLDYEYLMNMNLHIFSNSFVDYSDAEVQDFVNNFRDLYHNEPDFFAFQGYDIISYFMNAMSQYGTSFMKCIEQYNKKQLVNHFIFSSSDINGHENKGICIYRYENYKAVNALINPKKEILLLEKK